MNRPLHGPQNPTPVDESTDTYDTIDWLVKNMPETQRQGGHARHLLRRLSAPDGGGASAPGAQGCGAHEPHGRRLDGRRLVPQRRLPRAEHALHLRAGRHARQRPEGQVVVGALRRLRRVHERGLGGRTGSPTTGWSRSASGRRSSTTPPTTLSGATRPWTRCWPTISSRRASRCPCMLVHSLWDQEDIYGALAVYKAIKPLDKDNDKVFMVLGPWHHGQEIEDAASLGAIRFGSDTGTWFRQNVLRPVSRSLPEGRCAGGRRGGAGDGVRNRREPLAEAGCVAGGAGDEAAVSAAGLQAELASTLAANSANTADSAAFDEYVSDPAKPVPFRARPSQPIGYDPPLTWAAVAGRRSARGLRPHRRADLHLGCADRARCTSAASRSPTWSPRPAAPIRTGWSS